MAARNFLANLNNFGPSIIPQYSPNPAVSNLAILCIWVAVAAGLAVCNTAVATKVFQSRPGVEVQQKKN
jgi:hypothetical protein